MQRRMQKIRRPLSLHILHDHMTALDIIVGEMQHGLDERRGVEGGDFPREGRVVG